MFGVGPRFGLSYEIASVRNQDNQELTEFRRREMAVEAVANEIAHGSLTRRSQFRAVDPDLDAAYKKSGSGYHVLRLLEPLRLITGSKCDELMKAYEKSEGRVPGFSELVTEPKWLAANKQKYERLGAELAAEKPTKRLFITVEEARRGPFVTDVRIEDIPSDVPAGDFQI